MAHKGDLKAKARPVASVGTVRYEMPVTIVYRAADDVLTPVDYSDMTRAQMRGIAAKFHVTAVICRTCGDEAPYCREIAQELFS